MAAAGTRWNEPLGLIGRIGIVPVVTIDDIDATVPLVRAVVDGGLTVVEITLRTSAGLAAISRAVADLPDAVVGAGSVMTADATIAAIEAGARFIVSPGLDDGVIAAARARGVAILPGVGTATELMRAVAMDVDTVKLSPPMRSGVRRSCGRCRPFGPPCDSYRPAGFPRLRPANTLRCPRCSLSAGRG